MTFTTPQRDTALAAAASTAFAALSLAVTIRVALQSERGQGWDTSAMNTVVGGRDAQLTVLSVLGYVSIGAIVVVAGFCAAVALIRDKAHLAIGAVIVIGGANVTTQVLKHVVLTRPDFGFSTLNSLPSGHVTVVASAFGAALLVAPRLTRPVIATLGGFAITLTGTSTIVAGWHRPADVLASLAVSLIWTGLIALLMHGPALTVSGTFIGSALGCLSALVFLVAIGVRPLDGWNDFFQAAAVLGTVTVASLAFVLAVAEVSPTE